MSKRAVSGKAGRRFLSTCARYSSSQFTALVDRLARSRDQNGNCSQMDLLEPRMMFSAAVGGRVYFDADGDGLRGQGERSLAGWTVYLDQNRSGTRDAKEPSTVTNAAGQFSFAGLKAGVHAVSLVPKARWKGSEPRGNTQMALVTDGKEAANVDFGVIPSLSVQLEQIAGQKSAAVDLSQLGSAGFGQWVVDWGDGTRQPWGGVQSRLQHNYSGDGVYEVKIKLVDGDKEFVAATRRIGIGDDSLGRVKPGVGAEYADLGRVPNTKGPAHRTTTRPGPVPQRDAAGVPLSTSPLSLQGASTSATTRKASASEKKALTKKAKKRAKRRKLRLRRQALAAAAASQSFSLLSLSTPAAHWEFDETSGSTVLDSSGNGNSGTISGATRVTNGYEDRALSFDGSNDRVQIASSSTISVTKDYSLSAWIYPDNVSSSRAIVTKLTDFEDKQFYLGISSSGSLNFQSEVNDNNYSLSGGELVTGQWQHVAATVDSDLKVRLYINGVEVASDTLPGEPNATTTQPVYIGRRGGTYNDRYFDGMIDDVRIYGEVLGPADIAELAGLDVLRVSLSASDPIATEDGEQPGTFTFTRDNADEALTVNFVVRGSAGVADYTETLGTSITFAQNEFEKTITITPQDDGLTEGREVVQIALLPGEGYYPESLLAQSVTIVDDEAPAWVLGDVYVRGDPYDSDNFGNFDHLMVKASSTLSEVRETYIKLDVSDVADTPTAKLRLYVLDGGADLATMSLKAEIVDDDVSEAAMYATRPSGTSVIAGTAPTMTIGEYVEIDITNAVRDAAADDGVLSLRLYSDNPGGDRWVVFASRDHEDIALQPALIATPKVPKATVSHVSGIDQDGWVTVSLQASDPADTATEWLIDWGDGSELTPATGNTPAPISHLYTDPQQSYTIRAIAVDGQTRRLQGDSRYADVIAADGPVAYYRLGELPPISSAEESSDPPLANGTYVPGEVWNFQNEVPLKPYAAQTPWVHGEQNPSVQTWPGYVEIPHNAAMEAENGTVSFWFQDHNDIGTNGLFSKDYAGFGNGGHLTIATVSTGEPDGSGVIYVHLQDGDTTYMLWSSNSPYADRRFIYPDEWHHVAFTWGSGGMKLYIDGQFVVEEEDPNLFYAGGIENNTEPIFIGASRHEYSTEDPIVGSSFSGLIDEVAMFDQALTPQQIHNHYFAEAATLTVSPATGGATLTENQSFHTDNEDETETGYKAFPIVVGNNNTLSFAFAGWVPDSLHAGEHINDAFELALLDASGKPAVATIGAGRDGFFNLTQTETPKLANGVVLESFDGTSGVVKLDVSKLHGQTLTLVARLINNDTDTGTTVTLPSNPVLSTDVLTWTPASTATPTPAPTQSVDFEVLDDVTAYVDTNYKGTSFDETSHRLSVDLALTNSSAFAIRGPLLAAITNIRPIDQGGDVSNVRLDIDAPGSGGGFTPEGIAYADLSRLAFSDDAEGRVIRPGETVEGLTLPILNPDRVRFQYDLITYGQLNTAPAITSDPYAGAQGDAYAVERLNGSGEPVADRLEIVGDGTTEISYALDGVDREGDEITYSIVTGPSGMSIDTGSGLPTLVWTPTTGQIGAHQVRLRATDSWGLYDPANDQTFTVRVIAAPANRPPQFNSTPIVDAYVGQEYVYEAIATDPDADDLVFGVTASPGGDFDVIGDGANEGRVTWTPTGDDVGKTFTVTLSVDDTTKQSGSGSDAQTYQVNVHPDPTNQPPVIVSEPVTHFTIPAGTHVSFGQVTPADLNVSLGPRQATEQGLSYTVPECDDGVGADPEPVEAGQIRGTLFDDLDGNGARGPNEAVLAGWTVFLDTNQDQVLDVGEVSTTTDSQGRYFFDGLSPGTYTVSEVIPTGWTQTSPFGAEWVQKADFLDQRTSSGIEGASASLIDGKIYVSHGYRFADSDLLSVYDISTDTWTHGGTGLPDATVDRSEMAGGTAGGKHYAIGGRTGPTAAVEEFNPSTGTWATKASLSIARGGLGAASWKGKIYVMGGRSGSSPQDPGTVYDRAEVYDPTTDTWTTLASMPVAVGDNYATVAYCGRVYVFGGTDANAQDLNIVQIYDIETNTWSLGTSMPTARSNAMAGVLNGRLVVFGGLGDLNSSDLYDPHNDSWSTGPTMVEGVSEIAQGMTFDESGIYSIGAGIFGASRGIVQKLEAKPASHTVVLTIDDGVGNVDFGNRTSDIDVDIISDDPTVTVENLSGVASDLQPGDTANFNVRLNGDGQAHVFNLVFVRQGTQEVLGSIPVEINASYVYDTHAIDPDDEPIEYAFIDNSDERVLTLNGATIDPATGLVDWEPTTEGTYTFTVEARDDRGGRDLQTYDVVVDTTSTGNTDPVIDTTAPTAAEIGRKFRYDVDAHDDNGDAVNYYVLADEAPAGMTVDRFTGLIEWTPTQTGPLSFTIRVTDGRGGSVDQVVNLDVEPSSASTNQAPVITSLPVRAVLENTRYLYGVKATDADGDAVTFALTVAPEGMAIDEETGEIGWQPSSNDVGSHPVVVQVTDARGAARSQTFVLRVLSSNEAPTITSAPYGPAAPTFEWTYQVEAQDPNGDSLSYKVIEGPAGADFSTQTAGLLVWTPQSGDNNKEHYFEIEISDGRGGAISQGFWLPVAGNAAPTLDFGDAEPIFKGESWQVEIIADDPEGTTLTYDLDPDAKARGMVVVEDAGTWYLRWTNPAQAGTFEATVTVTDQNGAGASASRTLTLPVNVRPSNNLPPEFISTPTGPALAGRAWKYDADATDANGHTLTYTLDAASLAKGLAIDDVTGEITWNNPTAGTHQIFVTATETGAHNPLLAVTQEFTLPVVSNAPPVIVEAPIRVGAEVNQARNVTLSLVDLNGDDVTLSLADPSGAVVTFDSQASPYTLAVSADPDGPTTVTLAFTPDTLGEQDLVIRATDERGASTEHRITYVVVDDSAQNQPPSAVLTARKTIAVGETFTATVEALDPEGDPLSFSLDANALARGMSIDPATGRITWTPVSDDLGDEFTYTVTVSDGTDDAIITADLRVVSLFTNEPPTITSRPTDVATAGRPYVYQATAEDPDGDTLTWILESGPIGASIDPDSGRFTWTPKLSDVPGPVQITIRVADATGAGESQTIELPVRALNTPPVLVSQPPTDAGDAGAFAYVVRAFDAEDDRITMTLNQAMLSQGATLTRIDNSSYKLEWASPTTGSHVVEITASDGRGGTDIQSFTLDVTTGTVDIPPVFVTDPVRAVPTNNGYLYQAVAEDPNGDPTYSLVADPSASGLQINEFTGEVTWLNPVAGTYTVTVTATQGTATAEQRYELTVTQAGQDLPPTVQPTSGLTTGENGLFRYTVRSSDPEGMPLRFELVADPGQGITIPDGMTIDNAGRIVWAEAGPVGNVPFLVRVTDEAGNWVQQPFSVEVTADAAPTIDDFRASSSTPAAGTVVSFRIVASDDVGISDIQLKLTASWLPPEGLLLPVNARGEATYRLPANVAGLGLTATVTVFDTAQPTPQFAMAALNLIVDEVDADSPMVSIASPYNGAVVSAPTNVIGTVSDTNLESYTVTATPIDGGDTITLGSGTNSVTNGPLALIDASLLANGSYTITVTATDGTFISTASTTITVDSNVKLGNFGVSFTDLTVPVLGIPITVRRSYDTLRATEEGDFGYGWKLDLFTTEVDVDIDAGFGSTVDFGFDELGLRPGFREGTRINVKLPDGSNVGFTAVPEALSGRGGILTVFGGFYRMAFYSNTPGISLTLTGSDPQLNLDEYGHFTNAGIPYNPIDYNRDFVLSTADGTQYLIDSATGKLQDITDRNGNKLQIESDGVVARDSQNQIVEQVRFQRDQFGRITAAGLVDASGEFIGTPVRYGYDAAGNLVSVINRVGDETTLSYGKDHGSVGTPLTSKPEFAHYLTTITNAIGVDVLEVVFRADGRIDRIEDPVASVGFSYTITDPNLPTGHTAEQVSDADNVPTKLVRDARGNTVRRVQYDVSNSKVFATLFEYDGRDDQTAVSEQFEVPAGQNELTYLPTTLVWQSRSTYDQSGKVLETTDALGNMTRYGNYDRFGNPGSITDALGNTTTNTYDERGNLTETRDAAGNVTRYTYDPNGNLITLTQVKADGTEVTQAVYAYDEKGRLLSSTDASGVSRYFAYDALSNQTHSWYIKNGKTVVIATVYDGENRVRYSAQFTLNGEYEGDSADRDYIEANAPADLTTWEQGVPAGTDWYTATIYNAVGQVTESIDRFGTITQTRYDARGNVVETRTQSETADEDIAWVVTRTFYDANGRAIATTDPFLLNNAGQYLDPTTEEPFTSGGDPPFLRVTHTIYDDLGRVTETRRVAGVAITLSNPSGDVYESSFNTGYASGAILSNTQTIYDEQGRVAQTIAPTSLGSSVTLSTWYEYDDAGRQTKVYQAIDLDQNGALAVTPDGPDADIIPDGGTELFVTEYEYDAAGRQSRVIDAHGHSTAFVYDKLGRVERTITDNGSSAQTIYDALGRRVAEIDALGRRTDMTYDDAGRLVAVTLPAIDPDGSATGIMDLRRPRYEYIYDAFGNQTNQIASAMLDPDGQTVRYYRKDTAGDDIEIYSRNVATPLPEAQLPNLTTTTFAFDELNRQTGRTLPMSQSESMTYYAAGEAGGDFGLPKQATDFEGRTVNYTYDEFGRVETRTYAATGENTRTVTYTYDALGRVVSESDVTQNGPSRTTSRLYNADGRLTQVTSPEGTINYEYDDATGLLNRTYTSGSGNTDTNYVYDELGRLKQVNRAKRNGATVAETTGYLYDKVGNLDKQTQANGVVVDHDYDALNRLVKINHFKDTNANKQQDGGEATVAQFDYGLDAAGNRTSATEQFDTDGNGTLDQTQSFDWKYDGLNRLVEEIFDGPGTSLDFTAKYTFDLASNRKTKTVDNGSNGSVDETTSYTYDANDRLQQELLDTDGLAGAERTTTYTYNNTVQTGKSVTGDITETHTYDYDAMGRMESSIVVKGGVTTTSTYAYNADGIRVEQTTDDGTTQTTTKYVIDTNNHTGYAQVLEEKNASGNVTKTYTIGHDVIAQATVDPGQAGSNAGTALAFLYDGHGSTRALLTPGGIILNDGTAGLQLFTYDAYGNLLPGAGTPLTTLLYSGELTDATTGLQYLRGNYFDPVTGRFTKLDPNTRPNITDPLSLHKYLYVHGNPIMGIDPSGENFTYVGLLTSAAILSLFMTVEIAQAPAPGDPYYKNSPYALPRDMAIVAGVTFGLQYLILPAAGAAGRFLSNAFRPKAGAPAVAASTPAEAAGGSVSITLREVNPGGAPCGNCAVAQHFNIAGRPAVALHAPNSAGTIANMEAAVGGRFSPVTSDFSKIVSEMQAAGPGAQGIVAASKHASNGAMIGEGHFFNAVNAEGKIIFTDATWGEVATSVTTQASKLWTHFKLLIQKPK